MIYKKILVLAPHTDDAELGCGGTIARFISEGAEVHVAAISSAQDSLPPGVPDNTLELEFFEAMKVLGVPKENVYSLNYKVRVFSAVRQQLLDDLIGLRKKIEPDLVLIPCSYDSHQDHQAVHAEGLRAFRGISLLGYELPWNQILTASQVFIELKEEHLKLKWEALNSYESQFTLKRPYFTKEFITGLAAVRGTQARVEFAEAYEVLRMKI